MTPYGSIALSFNFTDHMVMGKWNEENLDIKYDFSKGEWYRTEKTESTSLRLNTYYIPT